MAQEVQLLQEMQLFRTGGAAATGGAALWHRRCSCYRRYSTLAQEMQLLQEVQHFGTGDAAVLNLGPIQTLTACFLFPRMLQRLKRDEMLKGLDAHKTTA